jgi:uncharacterized protein HemX
LRGSPVTLVRLIASALLIGAVAIGSGGCGPSQAEVQAEIQQAQEAQAKAEQAQAAALKAQQAAEKATAAADEATKEVHDASVEIDRVGRHIDQMQKEQADEDDDSQ